MAQVWRIPKPPSVMCYLALIVDYCGLLWIIDYHGLSWNIVEYLGLSLITMDYGLVDHHGLSWIIMDYGPAWIIVD